MRSSIAKKLTNVSTLYYLFVLEKHFPDDRKKIKQKQNTKNSCHQSGYHTEKFQSLDFFLSDFFHSIIPSLPQSQL